MMDVSSFFYIFNIIKWNPYQGTMTTPSVKARGPVITFFKYLPSGLKMNLLKRNPYGCCIDEVVRFQLDNVHFTHLGLPVDDNIARVNG
uniref:Uncharacterized protein n=1 Tax=Lactuca sativa TaxID=4236 RepID=A0A9R1X104_LACSA|nr:hypothetical protein LSAT_V11C800396670 [Lactuca sativa]